MRCWAGSQQLPFVTGVTSPYSSGLISTNGTIGLATVQLDAQAQNISTDQAQAADQRRPRRSTPTSSTSSSAGRPSQTGREPGGRFERLPRRGLARAGGVVLRLPSLVPHAPCSRCSPRSSPSASGRRSSASCPTPSTSPSSPPSLSELIALGVGVDYALFIVNRHRRGAARRAEARRGRRPRAQHLRAGGLRRRLDGLYRPARHVRARPHLPLRRLARGGVRRPAHDALVADLAAGHARLLRPQGAVAVATDGRCERTPARSPGPRREGIRAAARSGSGGRPSSSDGPPSSPCSAWP